MADQQDPAAYTEEEIAELRECYALRDWEEGAESPRWLATLDAERRARGDMAAVMVERMKERDEARAVLAKLKACMGDAAAAASDTILKVSAERDRALALLSDLSDATWDCGWRGEIVQRAKALLEGADREHTK